MGRKREKPITGTTQVTAAQTAQQTQQASLVNEAKVKETQALEEQTRQTARNYEAQLGIIQQQNAALQEQRMQQVQRDQELQRMQQAQTELITRTNQATEQNTTQATARAARNPSRTLGLLGRTSTARTQRTGSTRQVQGSNYTTF